MRLLPGVVFALSLLLHSRSAALEPGVPAPPFSLTSGSAVLSLTDFRGKVIYLDFWASWCASCKKSFPSMNEIQKKYESSGLRVIGINLDTERQDAERFLAEHVPSFTVLFDPEGKSAEAYELRDLPSAFLVNRRGEIAAIYGGFSKENVSAIENQIREELKK